MEDKMSILPIFKAGELFTAAKINKALQVAANDLIEEALNHINNGEIRINGQWYRTSGTIPYPAGSFLTATTDVYYRTASVQRPFEPPAGWRFNYTMQETTGLTFVSTAQSGSGGTDTIRILQLANYGTNAGTKLTWTLVKDN